jgi:hypothetical protein
MISRAERGIVIREQIPQGLIARASPFVVQPAT